MGKNEGEFAKRFQDIANHTPLGILDALHLRERNPIYIPQSFTAITDEAKKDFYKWLDADPEKGGGIVDLVLIIRKWFGDK